MVRKLIVAALLLVALSSEASMRFKEGISLRHLQPQMVLASDVVATVYEQNGYACVITSGDEGVHAKYSLHYSGNALDYRTKHILESARAALASEIQEALGTQFNVILESTHLHVEFDPK